MLGRVGARGRGQKDGRSGAKPVQKSEESPKQQRRVRAEIAPVLVHLINDHMAQVGQEAVVDPFLLVAEECHVEVVGRGKQGVARVAAEHALLVLRRVPVVGPGFDLQRLAEFSKLVLLIEGQGLHGVDQQCVTTWIAVQRIQHRDGEGQSLSAGRWGLQNDMVPRDGPLHGIVLVLVGPLDPEVSELGPNVGMDFGRPIVHEVGPDGLQGESEDDVAVPQCVKVPQVSNEIVDRHGTRSCRTK